MKSLFLIGLIISLIGGIKTITLGNTYTTDFSVSENPLSQGGNWINGGTVGLDWTNVATTNGFAHGTERGSVEYNDSTALLTGAWGSNQIAQATVHIGTRPKAGDYIELELRLRSSLSAGVGGRGGRLGTDHLGHHLPPQADGPPAPPGALQPAD